MQLKINKIMQNPQPPSSPAKFNWDLDIPDFAKTDKKPKTESLHGKPEYGRSNCLPANTPLPVTKIKPVAKKLKKITSNLGKAADQIIIYRATYLDYLMQNDVPAKYINALIKYYDNWIDNKKIPFVFPLPVSEFHSQLITHLNNL